MQHLIHGIHSFRKNQFGKLQSLFEQLAQGQKPEVLFITCSDSRICPNLLTQSKPGDLFILRNAGNIVPPYGAVHGGENATIEFAVAGLGVKDIIVCGHSLCGAMNGLLNPAYVESLPEVATWLRHAEATRQIMRHNYQHLEGEPLLAAAIEENVLVQLENLRTHPSVAARLASGDVRLHGWVYELETAGVFAYSPEDDDFVPIGEYQVPDAVPAPRLLATQNI